MSDPEGSETTEEQDIQKAYDIIDGYETISNDVKQIKEFIEKFEKDKPDDSQEGGQEDPPPQTPPPSTETDPPPPQTPPTTSPEGGVSLESIKEELKGISDLKDKLEKVEQQLTSMTTGRSFTFKLKKLEKPEDK